MMVSTRIRTAKIFPGAAALLAVLFLFLGILLRIVSDARFPHIVDNNLSSYYFGKFNYFIESGRLPEKDVWGFAPSDHPENVPPGLAYVSVFFFAIARFFTGALDPVTFAAFFPVLVFILISLTVWLLLAIRDRDVFAALAALTVLAFTPIFASFTAYGYYVQEIPGTFFLFLAIYFVSRLDRSRSDRIAAIFSIVMLVITWQQFPIFYVGGIILTSLLVVLKKRGDAAALAAVLAVSFAGAEVALRILRSGYSAFAMVREIVLGAVLFLSGDPDFIAAMANAPDWLPTPLPALYAFYGPFTLFLAIAGIAISLLRAKTLRNLAAAVFGLLGFAMIFQFQKERSLSFVMFLLPAAIAGGALASGDIPILRKETFLRSGAWRYLEGKRVMGIRFLAVILVFLTLAAGWIFTRPHEPPVPRVDIETITRSDGTIDATVRLTNLGGTTFNPRGALWNLNAGVNLEVENGDIEEFDVDSPLKDYEWYHYHVYKYKRLDNILFMETRYKQLGKNRSAVARIRIAPEENRPVMLYARGWLTDGACAEDFMKKSAQGLIGPADPVIETCIVRFPATDAVGYPECPFPIVSRRVAGGTGEFRIKPLRCAVETLVR